MSPLWSSRRVQGTPSKGFPGAFLGEPEGAFFSGKEGPFGTHPPAKVEPPGGHMGLPLHSLSVRYLFVGADIIRLGVVPYRAHP